MLQMWHRYNECPEKHKSSSSKAHSLQSAGMISEIKDETEDSLLQEAAALEARVKLLKEQALRKRIDKLKAEQAALEAELSSKPSLPIAASAAGPSSSSSVVAVPKASIPRTATPGSTLSEEVVFWGDISRKEEGSFSISFLS